MVFLSFLVVVQIVNIDGIAFLEAENDSPVRPNRHRPEARVIAFQRVEPKAGQSHILRRSGHIQPRENVPHSFAVISANSALVAPLEKLLQRPAPEASHHDEM
jgi:hypothetical protein